MRRSARQRLIYLIAILFAAIPFAFGLIRALQTGTDFRYLWVAIVSFVSAAAVMAIGNVRNREPTVTLPAAVLVIATLDAAATAYLLGARSAPAVLVVALAFALCWSASCALYAISRRQPV
jgi:hypothetical protein